MNEVVTNATDIWGKVQAGDISAFTISDIIWAVGFIVLTVLAVKIGYKLAKIIFIIVAIAILAYFLISKGIIVL